jgi:hypothetical protein
MHYQISRNGQMYGPYTLDDLRRYLASGNVQPTDLVKNEEMPEWIPVSQLLASNAIETPAVPIPPVWAEPAAPVYGQAAYPATNAPAIVNQYPDAPNLNWGLLLLINFFCCCVFQFVWNLIVAAWTKRVQPNSSALYYYIASDVIYVLYMGFYVFTFRDYMAVSQGHVYTRHLGMLGARSAVGIVFWVIKLMARFQHRESLLQHFNGPEPVGLRLSGVMTFFFGGLYFQYHLNRINAMKAAARYGAVRY